MLGRGTRASEDVRGLSRQHATVVFLVVFALSLAVLIPWVRDVPYRVGADEGVYLRYAKAVSHDGLRSLPGLMRSYLQDANPGMWPPPTRVGFLIPAAVGMRLMEDGTPQPLTYVSALMFLASVVLIFWFVRRNASPTLALLTATLLAFSPLLMGLARRALTDSTITFLTFALLASFYEMAARSSRLASAAFGLTLTWLLLTKETAFLALPVLVVLGLLIAYRRRSVDRAVLLAGSLATAAGLLLAALVFVLAAGGIGPLVKLAGYLLQSPETNAYVIQYFRGPWYRFLVDMVILSPLTVLLAIGFSFHYVLNRYRDGAHDFTDFVALYGLLTLLVNMGLAMKTGGYATGVRQLLPLEFPLCFLAACGLLAIGRAVGPALAPWVVGALCVVVASQDAVTFHRAFVARQLYDPNTPEILRTLNFLPQRQEQGLTCDSDGTPPRPAFSAGTEALMDAGVKALYTRKSGAEAELIFREVLARNPTYYPAMFHLAVMLENCGRVVEARSLWKQVLPAAQLANDEKVAATARERLATWNW
jgi:hypothetical protein